MVPDLVTSPAFAVVGQRVVGKPNQLGKLVPKAWKDLRARLPEIEGVVDPRRQIGFLLPEEKMLLGRLVTYIGVEIAPAAPTPKGLTRREFPSGPYAEFVWTGSFLSKEFAAFYPGVFAALKEHDLQVDPKLGWIEIYDDATHDWEDKANPGNTLRVRFPLLVGKG